MWNGLSLLTFKLPKLFWVVFAALSIGAMSLLVFSPYLPHNVTFKESEVSPVTLFSKTNQTIPISLNAREYRGLPSKIYVIDEEQNAKIQDALQQFFLTIKEDPNSQTDLTAEEVTALTSLSPSALDTFEYFTIRTAKEMLNKGITSTEDMEKAWTKQEHQLSVLPPAQKLLMGTVLFRFLRPNIHYSESKSSFFQRQNSKFITLKEGQPIIYKGDIVTAQHMAILKSLGLIDVKMDYKHFFGILIVTSLFFLLLERYVYYFLKDLYAQPKYFILIVLIMLVVVAIARGLEAIPPLPYEIHVMFLVPVSIAAMLLAFLVSARISFICGSLISVFVALSSHGDLNLFVFLFLSNSVAFFAMYNKHSRQEIIQSGYIIGLFNILIIGALGLLTHQDSYLWYLTNSGVAFLNGIVSGMISLAILPYLEQIFNITTRQTLLELANLNHPLLKRLLQSAPGTYQHSIMVGNLAEAAAEALQADPIIAKVGAYFHDIGKTKRPLFFTENQFSGQNPHHGLSARMSKLIIVSHIKDGYEMGVKNKLPKPILDIILEHHGTTMVSFLYNRAMKEEESLDVELAKEEFRYTGPKPQFKESGIVMLADSVEAASHSLEKPTLLKIEALIDRIIKEKIDDGQFDECPLSLQEIDVIKTAFLSVFKGIYHTRIDYEEEISTLMEKNK